ncbi:MAG TPA: glycosyltransferase family 2 protein [Bryobacteraceae bacterium]|nr:glycosyltransferase family 2 protein [Bryobacteraceae bacterium]
MSHCLKLSVVIPARNEARSIGQTLAEIGPALRARNIPFEIIVVDDGSGDETAEVVRRAQAGDDPVILVANPGSNGFGNAVRRGLERCSGDAVAIMMADGSDSADDLVMYWDILSEGYDCAFGSRFVRGGTVIDYPMHKLVLNRLTNNFIRLLFGFAYNDVTNAFKCYRKEVIAGMQPLISPHFNLTVEMPLKAIVRGYSYKVAPICWRNRKTGISKLKLQEMGSRYLFIVLILWLEKHLTRGDYRREKSITATAQKEAC